MSGKPRVPFVNCCQFMYLVLFLSVLRAWDLTVSVPDNCLSFYSAHTEGRCMSAFERACVRVCVQLYRVYSNFCHEYDLFHRVK